ncbi:SH3-domain-containing protein [Stereum hirsutum FP-91666 SS1]|uniref:SH3-domain-containing protein n=1 Tax=Stereum hirsutum (strain FP-91666) TaxID=721885 RepID=UPI00044496E9|nr:SH3-domain-containing protein [Stereum hirsutum FP-91666 SS1]EIM85453.1 SH3-domain-containing protein [Stereum hirsutum FP-91666 SS1]
MVFSNLPTHEKDAFFSLLDEYFTSRPDILGSLSSDSPGGQSHGAAAGAAVHKALANNPALTANLVSTGLKNVPKSSPYSGVASNTSVQNAAGRVAAASLAFSGREQAPPSSSSTKPTPPAFHARNSSSTEDDSASASSATRNLAHTKRFGDVDTSSAKNMFTSLRNSTANKSATPPSVAPPIPAAFGPKRGGFAPPPVRHVSPAPAPEPEPEPEEETAGEWAEALYDYSSAESTDLEIRAGQRILVTERSSADWWTGVADGKSGLFPAAYVKLL